MTSFTFWGCRGSIATGSPDQHYYGTNSPCSSIDLGDSVIIFDAGAGLIQYFRNEKQPKKNYYLIFSHFHWDHIIALPFFLPFYQSDQNIIIVGHDPSETESVFNKMLDGHHHPVSANNLHSYPSFIQFKDFQKLNLLADFQYFRLNHPGVTFGYTFCLNQKRFVFCSDNEIDETHTEWVRFLTEHASHYDILIHDAQYSTQDYKTRLGWGHSTYKQVLELGKVLCAEHVFFFHHNPTYSDQKIDALFKESQAQAEHSKRPPKLFVARENHAIIVDKEIRYQSIFDI